MSAVTALAGGVFETAAGDDAQLHRLVDDIGSRSRDARIGRRGGPELFDGALWQTLEETGLTRLTSTADLDVSPAELAIVLRGLARHACAVPIAETGLAAWLGGMAGLKLPDKGPLTVAITGAPVGGPIIDSSIEVPWTRASTAVVLAACGTDGLYIGLLDNPPIEHGHNLAGEPRDRISVSLHASELLRLDAAVGEELLRRGAWARCMQTIGALDAAAELSVAHARDRVQFGRALSGFQAVQHASTLR